MIDIKDKSLCSGCGACYSICPVGTVTMQRDGEGFLYPSVEKSTCIDCGMCEKVCGEYKSVNAEHSAYACINKDEDVRKSSSSGGVFYLLAEYILDNGGVVFGAAFDKDFSVHHIAAENKEDLQSLMGSKYLQSRIEDTYKKAKNFLDKGKTVLFSGTPCQTDGFLKYLGKEYDNLILQDIICHGVPSPKVWEKYVIFRRKTDSSTAQRISFRQKTYGWKTFSVLFEYSDNTKYEQILSKDLFMKSFLKNLSLRPSCYSCQHKNYNRMSDITLADFWGIEKEKPHLFDDKGTSLVWIHSLKGKEIFEKIKDKTICEEVDINEALKYNKAALESVKLSQERKIFFDKLDKMNFDKLVKKIAGEGFLKKVKIKLKFLIKRR